MDSESVLSFLDSESIISDSSTSISRNTRGKTAVGTWKHARPAVKGDVEVKGRNRIMYCLHCPKEDPYSTSVTTSSRQRLENQHDINVVENLSPLQSSIIEGFDQLYGQARDLGRSTEIESQVFKGYLDEEKMNKALAWLVVILNLPYRIVESREFHLFISTLNPLAKDFLPSAHSTIPGIINQQFQSAKKIVRLKLQSAISKVHLSLDIWTSPNRLLLLGICAHFVDHVQEARKKTLLALRPVANHSGEEQLITLMPVLRDFGIVRRIGSVVGDNSSTNDTLCRAFSACLKEEEGIDWDPEVNRLRCMGHIINLAVQAFLFQGSLDSKRCELYDNGEELEGIQKQRVEFRLLGPLGKLHNLVINIRSSSGRTKEFNQLAGRGIPLDNRTRWNSWYQMLHVATEKGIAGALDTYTKNHFSDLSADYLSPEDWALLRSIKEILQPFSRATLATQGEHATLDKVLFTMDVLIRCFDEALISYKSHPELSPRIRKGWEVFDKYYSKTDTSPYYAAALVLHPSYRTTYIHSNWKKKWHKTAFKQVKDLWCSYRDLNDGTTSYHAVEEEEDNDLDAFDRISRNLQNCARPTTQDEYEDYISGDPYDITPRTALSWWLQERHRKRWPKLSRMAIDILSMPAMSDEPERVFSGARRTISWERAQLDADQIEKGECLKHWVKNNVLDGDLEVA
ncbi:hypothetical protein HIM_10412 [Hirsutella minnesotensis 3608]|uniref:HAT C-terminal dimerisation domain-containing protein n=1 Tax=Hirsutella minnesotensis 3608 TaxID=1043627 RepID=A0A0F8A2C0_9HYPO|nr:hypothetical protein HIM_10412 [Hirsutella minnesotensis 3608]